MKLYNVWDASRQVLSIYNEEPLHINIEYSDKMSRTSQSLVDVNIYKSLLNLKTKYTNWEEQLERVNPYKHVCDYTFKEILEFSEIKFRNFDSGWRQKIQKLDQCMHLQKHPEKTEIFQEKILEIKNLKLGKPS